VLATTEVALKTGKVYNTWQVIEFILLLYCTAKKSLASGMPYDERIDFRSPTAIKIQAGWQSGSEPSTEALEDPVYIGRAS
jgi:hypothetical protein